MALYIHAVLLPTGYSRLVPGNGANICYVLLGRFFVR